MSAAIPASCHSRRRSPPLSSGSAAVTPTRSKPAPRALSSRMRLASPGSIRSPLTVPRFYPSHQRRGREDARSRGVSSCDSGPEHAHAYPSEARTSGTSGNTTPGQPCEQTISQARGVAAGPDAPLLHDAERKMCDPRALDHPRALQLDRPRTQVLEQPNAVPEQDGHQVNVYLVEEPGPDALLHDARGAYGDVLLARGRFRLLYGALDTIRDERERRPLVYPFLRNGVGEDKGWYPQGGAATPPVGDEIGRASCRERV